MRIIFITLLIASVGIIMFQLGKNSQQKHLNKTIILTLQNDTLQPSEGDLMRVQYINNKKVYLCIID
jgi:hypothetical protein